MARQYGQKAVERLYFKLEGKLRSNCEKLRHQTGFYEYTVPELMQEGTMLFFKHFADYYEDEEQYLRFLFISIKNKIRTLQKKVYTYNNRYKNGVAIIDGELKEFWLESHNELSQQHSYIDDKYYEGFKKRLHANPILVALKIRTECLVDSPDGETVVSKEVNFIEHLTNAVITGERVNFDALLNVASKQEIKHAVYKAV